MMLNDLTFNKQGKDWNEKRLDRLRYQIAAFRKKELEIEEQVIEKEGIKLFFFPKY